MYDLLSFANATRRLMNRYIVRPLLLMLCLLAIAQPARASQCRHVDRLVMAQDFPSFGDSNETPAWETTEKPNFGGWTTTCHKPTGDHSPSAATGMVGGESTAFLMAVPEVCSRLYFIYPDKPVGTSPPPDPRPPRIS